jgi:hypothetical protein
VSKRTALPIAVAVTVIAVPVDFETEDLTDTVNLGVY